MKKKSGVYRRLLFSYIGILMLPLCIAMVVYGITMRNVRMQAERMNQQILESVRLSIDTEIDSIQKISQSLCMNNEVQLLSRVEGEFGSEDQMNIYHLYQALNATSLPNDWIEDAFVYFNYTQKVVSLKGTMDASLFYQLYYEREAYDFSEFQSYMESFHYNDILYYPRAKEGDVFLFTITGIRSGIGESSGTICLTVPADKLRERLQSSKWRDGMQAFILNAQDEKIGNDSEILQNFSVPYASLTEDSSFTDRSILSTPCVVTTMKSQKGTMRYVTVTPMSYLDGGVRQLQLISFLGFLICIFSGFLFSYLLTKRSYNPLQTLLENFQSHGNEMDSGADEYQWLNQQVTQVFKEQRATRSILAENQKHLKDYYLTRLLLEPYDDKPLQEYGISFSSEYYQVVLLKPIRGNEASQQKLALERFVIQNVMRELCEQSFSGEIWEIGERVAMILNFAEKREEEQNTLREYLEQLRSLTEESFHFETRVLVGPVLQGIDSIRESYQKANVLSEYVHILDETFIVYDEVKDIQNRFDYPMELEEKLIRSIQVGEEEAAEKYIHEICERNLTGKYNADTYRRTIYGLSSTLLKAASLIGSQDADKKLDFPNGRELSHSPREVEEKLLQNMRLLCGEVRMARKESAGDNSFMEEVQEYIRLHYQDPDLNVSTLSLSFDKTPAYLSSIYKKQCGHSILEEINEARMKKAEELLASGATVAETAEQSGFRDSASFIRAFKKKKGVTPGQMKKMS